MHGLTSNTDIKYWPVNISFLLAACDACLTNHDCAFQIVIQQCIVTNCVTRVNKMIMNNPTTRFCFYRQTVGVTVIFYCRFFCQPNFCAWQKLDFRVCARYKRWSLMLMLLYTCMSMILKYVNKPIDNNIQHSFVCYFARQRTGSYDTLQSGVTWWIQLKRTASPSAGILFNACCNRSTLIGLWSICGVSELAIDILKTYLHIENKAARSSRSTVIS